MSRETVGLRQCYYQLVLPPLFEPSLMSVQSVVREAHTAGLPVFDLFFRTSAGNSLFQIFFFFFGGGVAVQFIPFDGANSGYCPNFDLNVDMNLLK